MIAEQLRETTRSIHAETEKLLVTFLKSAASSHDYVAVLRAFYGFLLPLERQIASVSDRHLLPDYNQRRKAGSLIMDLAVLGHDAGVVKAATAQELPMLSSHAQAIGALYVFEGSTLGGSAIIQLLRSRISLPENAFSFFGGYGANTLSMWKAFLIAVDDEAHKDDMPSILEAAGSTFSFFKQWLQKTLVYAAVEG